MKKETNNRIIALMLVLLLTGCGTKADDNTVYSEIDAGAKTEPSSVSSIETSTETASSEAIISTTTTSQITETVTTTEDAAALQKAEEERKKEEEEKRRKWEEEQREKEEEERKRAEEERILAEQRNSYSMMCYLALTAEEIRTSRDNRLALEEIYTSLLNDINPGAVDKITQDHLRSLRDIIKNYITISTKRDRLQFIYNQEKATAIRNAVPNPLSFLSVSNSKGWRELALSIAYTAVDSYNNYKRSSESADMAFLMSGWELDDAEKEAVMKNRNLAFDYMVNMVREYGLDGSKTLNEKSIQKFAEISATENPAEKIQLFKAEISTYSILGNYWLELADAYFETNQYKQCLECVEEYEKLSTNIYRKDFNYLRILPKAIVAAQETYSGTEYVSRIREYVDAMEANVSSDNWSARYFAAEVYLDLYSRTNNRSFLEKAYTIAKENVTILLKEQRSLNETYLDEVVELTATEPDYRFMTDEEKKKAESEYKEEKKRVKEYNKALKNTRKTELPSLYEPLVINCELLFSLADKIDLSSEEKAEIEATLRTNSNGIFMVKPINDKYSLNHKGNRYSVELTKEEGLIIPADLLTTGSTISIIIEENGNTETIDDCTISEVERDGTNIAGFQAYISSKNLKKHEWTADSKVEIKITYTDVYDEAISFKFYVSKFEEHWYGDKVVFAVQ